MIINYLVSGNIRSVVGAACLLRWKKKSREDETRKETKNRFCERNFIQHSPRWYWSLSSSSSVGWRYETGEEVFAFYFPFHRQRSIFHVKRSVPSIVFNGQRMLTRNFQLLSSSARLASNAMTLYGTVDKKGNFTSSQRAHCEMCNKNEILRRCLHETLIGLHRDFTFTRNWDEFQSDYGEDDESQKTDFDDLFRRLSWDTVIKGLAWNKSLGKIYEELHVVKHEKRKQQSVNLDKWKMRKGCCCCKLVDVEIFFLSDSGRESWIIKNRRSCPFHVARNVLW